MKATMGDAIRTLGHMLKRFSDGPNTGFYEINNGCEYVYFQSVIVHSKMFEFGDSFIVFWKSCDDVSGTDGIFNITSDDMMESVINRLINCKLK